MIDVQGALIRHVTQPLWMRRLGLGPVNDALAQFRALESATPAEVQAQQSRALVDLLEVAAGHTDYYGQLFREHGVNPQDGAAALSRLPRLTKAMIRGMPAERMINRRMAKAELQRASTGGSTGLPLQFYRSRACQIGRRAQDTLMDGWIGLRIGDPIGFFVSASHHVDHGAWKDALRNATLERLMRCDPSRLDDEYLADFHQRLWRFGPRYLKCFPSSLAVYARFLRKQGLKPPPVRGITATGETLHEWQREAFEEIFQAPVYERYGTKESGLIAGQCEHRNGMHIFTPGAYVEVVRADGTPCAPGEQGAVLVTDLLNDGMPLVRYEIGDLAVQGDASPCACGRPFPRIARILGRDRDLIIDAQGQARPGYLFVEVINAASLDVQFQLHQIVEGELEVRILRHPDAAARAGLESVMARFSGLLGGGKVSLVEVDELPRDRSGKYPYVVSEPGRRFQGAPPAA